VSPKIAIGRGRHSQSIALRGAHRRGLGAGSRRV